MSDLLNYHYEYKLPLNLELFTDNCGYKIPMNKEIKSSIQAKEYFNKLKETMGIEYNLNYYEILADDNLENLYFDSNNEIEKIIRIIAISDKDKFNKKELKLGVITIDLSNVLDKNGKQLYKNFFKNLEREYNNELCNI